MSSVPTFQFHKGTIRTGSVAPYADVACLFQFHKGTIRTASGAGTERTAQISIP